MSILVIEVDGTPLTSSFDVPPMNIHTRSSIIATEKYCVRMEEGMQVCLPQPCTAPLATFQSETKSLECQPIS